MRQALETRLNVFGEEHASTANGCDSLFFTQLCLGDLEGGLESARHTPHVQIELGVKQAAPDSTETYGFVILHYTALLSWRPRKIY